MSLDADALWALLPAVHRNRDEGALRALIEAVAQQVMLLEEDLSQLYDDQFIETCAEWVVPYIGDLVGYRQLHGATGASTGTRAEVADTVRLRRGKGTARMLETLAQDVTGWGVHVVEMFRRLATTVNVNHVPGASPGTVSVRRQAPLVRLGGPFDGLAHGADTRALGQGQGRGWYGVENLVVFLWRLRALPVNAAPAARLDGTRFLFSPHGTSMPLFSAPAPRPAGALATGPENVAQPMERRALAADLSRFYGPGLSFSIDGVPASAVSVCDLSDAGGAWAHAPAPGRVAVDPVLGRLAFGSAPAAPPRVSYHHGFAGPLGGGGYDRSDGFEALSPLLAIPEQFATLEAGLAAAAGGGTVEIGNSGRYAETLAFGVTRPGARLELRAAEMQAPFLALGGEALLTGAEGTELVLNGLWVSGGPLRVPAAAGNGLRRLVLRHCTLTPGLFRTPDGGPASPGAPSLVVETELEVEIDRCVLGSVFTVPDASVTVSGSIIDASAPTAPAYAGPDGAAAGGSLSITDSTVIGKVHAARLMLASNTLFSARLAARDGWAAPVWAATRHVGCTRFSFIPAGSLVPRPYRCQPEAGPGPGLRLVRPAFTSTRFGDPGYCQLGRRTPAAIAEGAEDGSEMGAFRANASPRREANLRARLNEHLRFGFQPALVFVT